MSWPGESARTQPPVLLQGTGPRPWPRGAVCTVDGCKLMSRRSVVPSLPAPESLWGSPEAEEGREAHNATRQAEGSQLPGP